MNKWHPIQKPAEVAEQRLLEAILSGHFAVDSPATSVIARIAEHADREACLRQAISH